MKSEFVPDAAAGCFSIYRQVLPTTRLRGAVLHVPAFAEEMNKSRRMISMQSRALVGMGWSVLQLDPFGTGDSEGDFAEATWDRWVADVTSAFRWLSRRTGCTPALWGARAGCLLAVHAAAVLAVPVDLVLWQPVASGAQHLQQFLRMKSMGHLFGAEDPGRSGVAALKACLQRGESIEVAGYLLSPELAAGLEAATLTAPATVRRVAWLEVGAPPPAVLPASVARIERWRSGGVAIDVRAVEGPAFWQTQEITECPALIAATCDALQAWTA